MAAQVSSSGLLKKLGTKLVTAHNASKDMEYKAPGGGELPPIDNGIAELVDCRIGEYKEGDFKGQPFFIAAGIVKFPKTVELDGVQFPVEGGRTQIGPEPLCDTPKRVKSPTFQHHYDKMLNWLLGLGLNVSQITGTPEQIDQKMVAGMAELVRQKVTFKFRTWKGEPTNEYPNPQVNHVWGAACEFNEAKVQDNQVVENPEPAPVSPPPAAPAPSGPGRKGPGSKAAPPAPAEPEPEDLDALAEAAGGEGKDADNANDRLCAIARGAGMDDTAIQSYSTWPELVAAIREAQGGTASNDIGIVVGAVVSYKPVTQDPKTKKKIIAKKAVDCEVTAIDEEKGTVDLKSIDDPRNKFPGVLITALETETAS